MKNIPSVGPVCSGVKDLKSIIPIFIEQLEKYNVEKANQHQKVFAKTISSIHDCEDFLLSTLYQIYDDLNECAPDDLYFGINHDTLSKNVMEYGFWPKHSLSVTH